MAKNKANTVIEKPVVEETTAPVETQEETPVESTENQVTDTETTTQPEVIEETVPETEVETQETTNVEVTQTETVKEVPGFSKVTDVIKTFDNDQERADALIANANNFGNKLSYIVISVNGYVEKMTDKGLSQQKGIQGQRLFLNIFKEILKSKDFAEFKDCLDVLNVFVRLNTNNVFEDYKMSRYIEEVKGLNEKEFTTLVNLYVALKEYSFAANRETVLKKISLDKVFNVDKTIINAEHKEWLEKYYK